MVELKGSLGGIGLPAIVQLIGELHHSGVLELSKEPTQDAAAAGALGFDDGRLISAVCGAHGGLAALTRVVLELGDGEFRFSEGVPPGERTLDLGGAELQRTLARIVAGEPIDPSAVPALAVEGEAVEPDVCPRLGFADDPTRNYSRPTALHRCYASIAPSLVTVQEQRDLCLGGQYPTCPRFRNAARASKRGGTTGLADGSHRMPVPLDEPGSPAVPVGAVPPVSPAEPVPPLSSVEPLVPVSPGPPVRRLSPADRVLPTSPARSSLPSEKPVAATGTGTQAMVEEHRRFGRRGLILVGSGVVLGLAALALLLLVTVPALNSRLVPRPSAATQAFEPVPTAPRPPATAQVSIGSPVAAAKPSAVASPVPTATIAVAAARATAVISAPSSRAPNPSVVDVRFAAGMPPDWVDNAPYAAWSAGAYRLRAQQATRFVAVGAPVVPPPDNAVVSATFRKTGGPPGGGYGLIARDEGPEPRDGLNQILNAYVFETGDQGEFGVWRRDGDRWIDLVPWTRSAAVRLGGSPNELVVRVQGDHLVFTVNGFELANLSDATLPSGGFGVFAGGDYNEVAVDHFGVQTLD